MSNSSLSPSFNTRPSHLARPFTFTPLSPFFLYPSSSLTTSLPSQILCLSRSPSSSSRFSLKPIVGRSMLESESHVRVARRSCPSESPVGVTRRSCPSESPIGVARQSRLSFSSVGVACRSSTRSAISSFSHLLTATTSIATKKTTATEQKKNIQLTETN